MTPRKMIRKTAMLAAMAMAAAATGVGPAAATGPTIDVAGGGAFTASAGTVTLSAGVSMSCTSAGLSGFINAGNYTTSEAIGTVASSIWNGCTALGFSSTISQSGTWNIVVTGSPAGGVTPVEITNVDLTNDIGSGVCTLHLTGTAGGTLDNASQELTLTDTSTLAVAQTGYCPGVASPGSLSGTYAVAAAAPVTVSSYVADPDLTVTGGGAFTASAGTVTFNAGASMSCTSAGLTGVIDSGSYRAPATIGTITSSTWNSCTALGFLFAVTQNGTWNIVATGAPSGGVTPGEITNMDATIVMGGGICTVHVTGTAGVTFDNATQELHLTGTPTLGMAQSGYCPGWASTGSLTTTYAVSAATPVTIS